MTRQVRTPGEIAQVNNDFDQFQLPFDASLNLGDFPAYGVTDTSVELSMVNVRHLNATRQFRGRWTMSPTDGTDPSDPVVPYEPGQVVIGSDNHLYMLNNAGTPTMNPVSDTTRTHWTLLSTATEPVTELTSEPAMVTVPLYSQTATTRMFTVRPSANAMPLRPTVSVTNHTGVIGDITATITAQGLVTVNVPPMQDTAGTAYVTVEMESSSPNAMGEAVTHPGGQIDIPVVISDMRTSPTVSPSGDMRINSISGRLNTDAMSPQLVYNIDLLPDGASVAAGTGYDAEWTATVNGVTSAPSVGREYVIPPIATDMNVAFNFPLRSTPLNRQTGSAPMIERSIRVYDPWFWSFGNTVPTSVASMNEGLILGNTQADDFPFNSGEEFAVTGPTNMIQSLFLAVPTTVNNAIVLNTGIAQMQPVLTNNQITATGAAGNTITYNLLQYRIGLVSSPTVFRIISTS